MTKNEFVVIWKDLLPGLRNFTLQLTSYNKEDAEDLIQETYIKAQLAIESYEAKFSPKTWVYSIAKNKFNDDYRKKKRRAAINNPIPDLETTFHEIVTDSNLGVSSFVMKDILDAINQLDEKEKEPFLLLIEGYQYEEIADKLEQPIGTIKVRIFSARRKLWDLLKDYEDIACKFKR